MLLSDLFARNEHPNISFELFPPKTEKGESNLYKHVERLMKYRPGFITCTYGAGGSTRDKTLDIVERVRTQFAVPVASHLTLVGSTVEDLRNYLIQARERGTDYIVALRGDPPQGQSAFSRTEGGLGYANELVEFIRKEFKDFGVIVAGYPEKHREAPDMDTDLDNLKRKVDAGADCIVTQLFYDNEDFFRFRDQCEQRGISVPVIPGLLPVTSLKQVQKITTLCGSKLPVDFESELRKNDDPDWQVQVGIDQAIKQTQGLLDGGVAGLHFYVLNKSDATIRILDSVYGNQLSGDLA